MNKKKILIIGGTGFIGKHLASKCCSRKIQLSSQVHAVCFQICIFLLSMHKSRKMWQFPHAKVHKIRKWISRSVHVISISQPNYLVYRSLTWLQAYSNEMDCKSYSHGLCSRMEEIFLEHKHGKEFPFWWMNAKINFNREINFNTKTRLQVLLWRLVFYCGVVPNLLLNIFEHSFLH